MRLTVVCCLLIGCSSSPIVPGKDAGGAPSVPDLARAGAADMMMSPAGDLARTEDMLPPPPPCTDPCGTGCHAAFHMCGSVCASNDNEGSCGATSCAPCPSVANSVGICVDQQCDIACNTGFHRCGGACIPESQCCSVIDCIPLQPLHGDSACGAGGVCVFFCDAGYVMQGKVCVPVADMAM